MGEDKTHGVEIKAKTGEGTRHRKKLNAISAK
jgi:hypothetical protein